MFICIQNVRLEAFLILCTLHACVSNEKSRRITTNIKNTYHLTLPIFISQNHLNRISLDFYSFKAIVVKSISYIYLVEISIHLVTTEQCLGCYSKTFK